MKFEDSADALAYDIAFWAMAFEDEHYDLDALGKIALELGQKLRSLGILGLLATGENSHLHDNLRRSGEYRLQYLQRVKASKREDQHHFVRGRIHPVFDLVAAGDKTTLESIVATGPTDFISQREYLPDYCYVSLLASFSLGDRAPLNPDGIGIDYYLEQYEQWLDGEFDTRFDLCKALAENDETAFLDAFDMLLAQRIEYIEEHRETDLEDVIIDSQRQIFVEGLALLAIANSRSFDVDQEFAMCPRSARYELGSQ